MSASSSASRRLSSASAAALELHQHWGEWSAALGKFALQASFALMAANWAIHGSQRGILANDFAKWSMAIGFIYLGVLLALIAIQVHLLKERHSYADSDRDRWQQEFDRDSVNVGSAWPYTLKIDFVGDLMRYLHITAPLAMGVLLLVSVFFGNVSSVNSQSTQHFNPSAAASGAAATSASAPASTASK